MKVVIGIPFTPNFLPGNNLPGLCTYGQVESPLLIFLDLGADCIHRL